MSSAEEEVSSDPWCETTPPDPFMVWIYWVVMLTWLCNTVILVAGCYQLRTSDTATKPIFKKLFALIGAFFFICPPGFAFGIQAGWECWYSSFRPWEGTYMIGMTGYTFGLAFLSLFFILRLKVVCDSPLAQLKLSPATLGILVIGLIIQFVAPVVSISHFLIAWDEEVRSTALTWLNVFLYTNTASNLIVLFLFLRRILFITQRNNNASSSMAFKSKSFSSKMFRKNTSEASQVDVDSNNNNNNNATMIDQALLSTAMRYTVCATLAVITTISVSVVGLIRVEGGYANDLRWRGLNILVHNLDTTANLVFLYLQFPFSKRLYSCCCKCMDACYQSVVTSALNLDVRQSVSQFSVSRKSKAASKKYGVAESRSAIVEVSANSNLKSITALETE